MFSGYTSRHKQTDAACGRNNGVGQFGEDGVGIYIAFAGEWVAAATADIGKRIIRLCLCIKILLIQVEICRFEFFNESTSPELEYSGISPKSFSI